MVKEKLYKCTYTSEEGAPCQVMGRYNNPDPSYCFEYNCTKKCRYCIPLMEGENPEKKIWCNEMSQCDSYNDGGKNKCEGCPAGRVVFDPVKELFKDRQECLVKDVCPRGDGFCTEMCHLCLNVSTLKGSDIYICIAAEHEVIPIEIDLTPIAD